MHFSFVLTFDLTGHLKGHFKNDLHLCKSQIKLAYIHDCNQNLRKGSKFGPLSEHIFDFDI